MLKNAPALLTAFVMSTGVLISGAAAAADENNGIHQWSDPAKAEFTIPNVRTKLLFPNIHYVDVDVHIDCDLMMEGRTPQGNPQPLISVGLIGLFNAESEATTVGLAPGALEVFENWKGSLDYRSSSQNGVFTHLFGAHDISKQQVVEAAQRCWTDFRGNILHTDDLAQHGEYHNDYRPK